MLSTAIVTERAPKLKTHYSGPDIAIPLAIAARADIPALSKILYGLMLSCPAVTCRQAAQLLGTPIREVISALNALRVAGLEVDRRALEELRGSFKLTCECRETVEIGASTVLEGVGRCSRCGARLEIDWEAAKREYSAADRRQEVPRA